MPLRLMLRLVRYGSDVAPLAIAHRGGAGLATENSIQAFSLSWGLGLRYLETDVRVTRDGVAVLVHDATLRRTHGLDVAVAAVRSDELPPDVARLDAVLRSYQQGCFALDVKDAAAVPAVAEVIRRTGSAERLCVTGTWDRTLAALADAVGPELSIAMGWRSLFELIVLAHGRGSRIRHGRAAFAHLPVRLGRWRVFSDELIRRAHRLGIRVVIWTVDDADTMHRLLDAGVDGLITDRPDRLREVLISREQWNAPRAMDQTL